MMMYHVSEYILHLVSIILHLLHLLCVQIQFLCNGCSWVLGPGLNYRSLEKANCV